MAALARQATEVTLRLARATASDADAVLPAPVGGYAPAVAVAAQHPTLTRRRVTRPQGPRRLIVAAPLPSASTEQRGSRGPTRGAAPSRSPSPPQLPPPPSTRTGERRHATARVGSAPVAHSSLQTAISHRSSSSARVSQARDSTAAIAAILGEARDDGGHAKWRRARLIDDEKVDRRDAEPQVRRAGGSELSEDEKANGGYGDEVTESSDASGRPGEEAGKQEIMADKGTGAGARDEGVRDVADETARAGAAPVDDNLGGGEASRVSPRRRWRQLLCAAAPPPPPAPQAQLPPVQPPPPPPPSLMQQPGPPFPARGGLSSGLDAAAAAAAAAPPSGSTQSSARWSSTSWNAAGMTVAQPAQPPAATPAPEILPATGFPTEVPALQAGQALPSQWPTGTGGWVPPAGSMLLVGAEPLGRAELRADIQFARIRRC